MRRLLVVAVTLAIFVPSAARATTSSYTAPFELASSTYESSNGALRRNDASASAQASIDGHLTGAVSMTSKLGGYVPFANGGWARAESSVGSSFTLPEGISEFHIVIRLHLERVRASAEPSALIGYPASAGVFVHPALFGPWCDGCYDTYTPDVWVTPGASIDNEDVIMTIDRIEQGTTLPAGTYRTGVEAAADACAGLRRSTAAADYDLTVTSIEVTY